MEILKAILDSLGAGGLVNLFTTIIASLGPGGLTAILIFGAILATRQLNRNGQISGERLVDKLMKDLSESIAREAECSRQVVILTRRVEILEREKGELVLRFEHDKVALEARIDALVSLFQGGSGIVYPKQDESETGRMRRWMFQHMNMETLAVAAEDAGLSKPLGDSLEMQILSAVDEARRLNLIPEFSSVIQARLPTVKPW